MENKFTLKDKIVRDSLRALNSYRQDSGRYNLVVDGGIANQVYLNQASIDLLRPTHDLDMISDSRLTPTIFREDVGKVLAEHLTSYSPRVSMNRHVLEVSLGEENPKPPFFIHAYRFTESRFNRRKKSLEKKVSNANEIITIRDIAAKVVRPEDVIQGKLARLREIYKNGNIAENLVSLYKKVEDRDWPCTSEQKLEDWLDDLKNKKSLIGAFYDGGVEKFNQFMEGYTSSKDLFDISVLSKAICSKKVYFDEKYYDELMQDLNN